MFTSILLASIVALPLVAGLSSNCVRTAVVAAGDTCDSISAARNSSTYQLATVNTPMINPECTNLVPGQTICLGTANEDCTTTYNVVPGDTCLQISARTGVNATILYANNPQINSECTNIYVGEVLCTLDQVRVPPAVGKSASPVVVAPGNTPAAPPPAQKAAGSPAADDDLPWCD